MKKHERMFNYFHILLSTIYLGSFSFFYEDILWSSELFLECRIFQINGHFWQTIFKLLPIRSYMLFRSRGPLKIPLIPTRPVPSRPVPSCPVLPPRKSRSPLPDPWSHHFSRVSTSVSRTFLELVFLLGPLGVPSITVLSVHAKNLNQCKSIRPP